MNPKVQVKGIRDGLLVTLGEGEWSELRQALMEHIDAQGDFLKGARLALDVGNHTLKAVELGSLRDVISDRGMSLWAVISNSPLTEQTAQTLGMATRISKPMTERTRPVQTRQQEADQALVVKKTLRSGFSLKQSCSIVVIGDVNAGAEIISGGDVVVWGRLRGVVHAGAEGDEQAVVCALEMNPTQLRIAGKIATTPQKRGKPLAEIARIKDGFVVAEPWNPKP